MNARNDFALTHFTPIRPRYESTQEQCLTWLAAAHSAAEERKRDQSTGFEFECFLRKMKKSLCRFGCGADRIARRGHELSDFLHFDWGSMKLFNLFREAGGAGIEARTRFYEGTVDRIFEKIYPEDGVAEERVPDHLVHVTCTGYVSPSGAQKLVSKRGWCDRTWVLHAYHMGCSAAMPAIRMAAGLLAYGGGRNIDIVHTELCSIHFDPLAHSPEQLVVQSLFADGAIRYSLKNTDECGIEGGLQVLSLHEKVIPDSVAFMGWRLGDTGMRMILSCEVPGALGKSLERFFETLFAEANLDFKSERERTVFAVHPGGPKILTQVGELLQLERWQLSASHGVLFDCGNMSSATLPHIWARLLGEKAVEKGTLIASAAFGPGLTMSGALLRRI